jgi:UDP-hydrolysing UDP-N-acetyl-D-glucosamine 2-epimerase
MKKICFITTSRADFGTLNELIQETINEKNFTTQLIVSGSHYNKIFGKTEKEISYKKKCLIKPVYILQNNNKDSKSVALSFSECVKKYTNTLIKLKPDIFVAFGDRYEMLAAVLSAYILRIPIAHIAGGEKTFGSLDEGYRHSISKLSNLHFPTMEIYKKTLIQLGENPKTIFNYGSLSELKILKNKSLSRIDLEKKMGIKFYEKNLVFTHHPETTDSSRCIKNLSTILNTLKKLKKTLIIITSPNADAKGIIMIKYINNFIKKKKLKNFVFFKSLGSLVYLSLLKVVDGVVGNSSSGISEVPLFGIGTVNIGKRQDGRFMFPSVINCTVSKMAILDSIKKIYNSDFRRKIKKQIKINKLKNSAKKIAKKILLFNFKNYKDKVFYEK